LQVFFNAQIVLWICCSAAQRKRNDKLLTSEQVEEGSFGLKASDISLILEAKDRWYVSDPNKAGDL